LKFLVEEKVKRKKPRGETVSGLRFLVEEKVKRKKPRGEKVSGLRFLVWLFEVCLFLV